jgi:hypothetical protein
VAVLDDFNRANGALGTASGGGTWSVLAGTCAIATNVATVTAGAPSATAALPFGDHDNGDFSLKVAVSSLAANPAGLVVRLLDNNNRLGCFLAASTQKAQIFKTDGGTTTMLVEAAATIAINTQYTVRARLTGALVEMFVDGVAVTSFTLTGGDETQYTNANGYTKVGFRGDTTASFDDLTSAPGQSVTTTGIASAEAFGTAAVSQFMLPTGVGTLEAFGAPVVSQQIQGAAIASTEAFGSHTVAITGFSFFPASIASAETFGLAVVEQGAKNLSIGSLLVNAVYVGELQIVAVYLGELNVF